MSRTSRVTAALRALTWAGTATAVALTTHTALNTRHLLRARADAADTTEPVSVLVPARDEESALPGLLGDLRGQLGVADLEIIVLDDRSGDDTAGVVARAAQADPRIRLITGSGPPRGALGKPHACATLADAAAGSVLVFVDADVRLHPRAVAACVSLLRGHDLAIVSPYPRQEAVSLAERLAQPLLQWSWLTTLPLGWAARSQRPSLSAANGQLLAVDAAGYRRAGGHTAVAGAVLEDIALMRAVRRTGGRGLPADGSAVASCRMYESWPQLREGYTKSLWEAFGSPAGAAAVMAVLVAAYVVPVAAALRGSRAGLVGYAAGVAGRVLTARATGGRTWPDALGHPASVVLAALLTGLSWRGHRRGTLTWKGRRVGASTATTCWSGRP